MNIPQPQESFIDYYNRIKSTRYCYERKLKHSNQRFEDFKNDLITRTNSTTNNISKIPLKRYPSKVHLMKQSITAGDISGMRTNQNLIDRSLYTSSENWISTQQRSLMIKSELKSMNDDCIQTNESRVPKFIEKEHLIDPASDTLCPLCKEIIPSIISNHYTIPKSTVTSIVNHHALAVIVKTNDHKPLARLCDKNEVCPSCAATISMPEQYRPLTARRRVLDSKDKEEIRIKTAAKQWDPLKCFELEAYSSS